MRTDTSARCNCVARSRARSRSGVVPRSPTRTGARAILVAAGAAAVLAGSTTPASAISERSASAQAVPGQMIRAPQSEALVMDLPVRVAIRVPRGTSRLFVRVGGRDISARFRHAGGSLRVAEVRLRDGLEYGINQLYVLAERRNQPPLSQASTFTLARRSDGIARLSVDPGAVTSVRAQVVGPIRLLRTVTFSLNGRPITGAADQPSPLVWTLSLSASQGLRYGVNRLQMQVVEPSDGRYALLNRTFVIPRNQVLPAAGLDIATRVGYVVHLGGGQSLYSGGGGLRYDWTVLSQPAGSHVAIQDAGSPRASFVPEEAGFYNIRLSVTPRTVAFTASAGPQSSSDTVTVAVSPSSLLLPFKGLSQGARGPGIEVGDQFFPNLSHGKYMQWLTLDRTSLKETKTGNSWFDGTAGGKDDPHGLDALRDALSGEGQQQLVILAYPSCCGTPVQPSQVDEFNKVVELIGVGPIDKGILTDHNKLAIIGVPYGEPGSGWYTHGGTPVDALNGWLMPDATTGDAGGLRYRFQPARLHFNTSAKSSPTTNTMTIGGHSFDATLPAGPWVGGFQVVWFNPIDLTPVKEQLYEQNLQGVPQLFQMARDLHDYGGNLVAVQSIGHVFVEPRSSGFNSVCSNLQAYGANPDTCMTMNGAYSFLGSPQLTRSQVAQSSSAIVIDPTADPPEHEPGTMSGVLRIRSDGYFMPLATDRSGSSNDSLYDVALSPSTPWPYTKAAGDPEADAYAKALAWITAHLQGFNGYSPDLRQAFVANPGINYAGAKNNLTACKSGAGPRTGNPGFTRKEFCTLSGELGNEFDWMENIKTLFTSYQTIIGRTGGPQQAGLQTIGEDIRKAVEPPDNAEVATGVLSFIEAFGQLTAEVTGPVGEAAGVLAGAYELASAIASNVNGAPLGDRISAKVQQLSTEVADNVLADQNALERLRDVIASDYGRLKGLGSVATSPGWSIDVPATTTELVRAASGYFSTELMPLAFTIDYLRQGTFLYEPPTVDNCYLYFLGHSWEGAPKTAWVNWHGEFEEADRSVYPYLLAFANRKGWSASSVAYPPPELTNQMFLSPNQGGYGLYLPDFIWTQYTTRYDVATCH
jgi:hypothetical protein